MPLFTTEIYSGAPPGGRRRLLLTADAAARYLGVSPERLCKWRFRRCGPPFLKIGSARRGSIHYELAALDRFLDAQAAQFRPLRPRAGRPIGARNRLKKPPESANGALSPVERMRRFVEGELAQKEGNER